MSLAKINVKDYGQEKCPLWEKICVCRQIWTGDHTPRGKTQYAIFSNEDGWSSKAPIRDYWASLSAADISFELFDDELLFSDDGFNEIADGNHATHFACFDNRQMADPYLGH